MDWNNQELVVDCWAEVVASNKMENLAVVLDEQHMEAGQKDY